MSEQRKTGSSFLSFSFHFDNNNKKMTEFRVVSSGFRGWQGEGRGLVTIAVCLLCPLVHQTFRLFVTSAKEVIYLGEFVCICLSVCVGILITFLSNVSLMLRNNPLYFGNDPDHNVDTGMFKIFSNILR